MQFGEIDQLTKYYSDDKNQFVNNKMQIRFVRFFLRKFDRDFNIIEKMSQGFAIQLPARFSTLV